jgi:hypothetical protein
LDCDVEQFSTEPAAGNLFLELPAAAARAKNFTAWEKQFKSWLAREKTLDVLTCKELKLSQNPGETSESFYARVSLAARENRDAKIDALRKKFAPKQAALQARLDRALANLETQRAQAKHATLQTAISFGTGLLGAFLGRKAISSRTVTSMGTAARGVSRTMKEGGDVASAEKSVEDIRSRIADLDAEFAADSAALAASEPAVETTTIKPARGGISSLQLVLGWLPK